MIEFDAASSMAGQDILDFSFSHTCSGMNRILIVGSVCNEETAGNRGVNGITYNGVALTKIGHTSVVDGRVELWYLVNPATGTNTIQVSYNGVNNFAAAGAISLTGVAQINPVDVYGGADAHTVDLTTTVNNTMVVDIALQKTNDDLIAGAGQTERWGNGFGAATPPPDGGIHGDGSTEAKTAPGVVTMSWTGGSGTIGIFAAAFRPPAGFFEFFN